MSRPDRRPTAGAPLLRPEDLDALGLGGPTAPLAALQRYLELLLQWNATYNLTAVRDPASIWVHHVLDCLAALPSVRAQLASAARPARVLDVGSGGGLPGVLWALWMPDVQVTCVDAVAKKAAFVRQVAGELGLPNLVACHARVETLEHPHYPLITSRAFASLVDFTRLTRHLLAADGCWVALKGKRPNDEMAALPPDVEVFHVEPVRVPRLDADRCLVWMRPGPVHPTSA